MEIVEDSVVVSAAADLPAGALTVGYAMTSGGTQMAEAARAYRWGKLRDSDPFVGSSIQLPQPNYAVVFELSVP